MPNLFNVRLSAQNKNYECSSNDSLLESGLHHGLGLCIINAVMVLVVLAKPSFWVTVIKKIKHHDFALSQDEMN